MQKVSAFDLTHECRTLLNKLQDGIEALIFVNGCRFQFPTDDRTVCKDSVSYIPAGWCTRFHFPTWLQYGVRTFSCLVKDDAGSKIFLLD